MFSRLPVFDPSLDQWHVDLLQELFPQIVPGNMYAVQPLVSRRFLFAVSRVRLIPWFLADGACGVCGAGRTVLSPEV